MKQQAVDKVDLLFMIDNSASMGDKQALLAQAVPDLVSRLVNPNCLDISSNAVLGVSSNGDCKQFPNSKAEFPPVHDMHIGIVSSSLGGMGSDACPADAKNPTNMALNAHNDDQGHLLNRGASSPTEEHVVTDTGGSNFLAWFPNVDANKGKTPPPNGVVAITDAGKLNMDFTDLISGVHEHGCGFEQQLESWYRFLVQPDPYQSITKNGNVATLVGVDQTILQQRHDFLRPDSLLTVIMVTDEDTDGMDPLSLSGQGWAFENSTFPSSNTGGAPKGTSACATNPGSDQCTSCLINQSDSNCNPPFYDVNVDQLNVRHIHMKQRYGLNAHFPVQRYIRGLTQRQVPNRDGEHVGNSANYTGEENANCVNPIFAQDLPTDPNADLCNLKTGPRTPDLVFYAAIVGVPHQLLQKDPNNPDSEQKDVLTDDDFTKMVGKDPLNFDYSGLDPHMIESITPRAGLPPPNSSDTADPINGREWDTQNGDLQYACVFDFVQPKDCSLPQFAGACDCDGTYSGPLCQTAGSKIQTRGKAYPGTDYLIVARKLGQQAIVSSICPIHVRDNASGTDPLFGYRPAVKAIVDRLRNALANQCLPNQLQPHPDGSVDCLILETLPQAGPESQCNDASRGFSIPNADLLQKFRDSVSAANGGDKTIYGQPVCAVNQILNKDLVSGSCAASSVPGWCYVTGAAAGTCSQAILFSPSGNPQVGATISLQCIESAFTGGGGGGTPSDAGGGG